MIRGDVLRGRYGVRRPKPYAPRGPCRTFTCAVTSEVVTVQLKRTYFGAKNGYVAECNQRDCQYVDDNRPPCPASVDMFKEEIAARLRAA